jgi:hypothetical protein
MQLGFIQQTPHVQLEVNNIMEMKPFVENMSCSMFSCQKPW